MNQALDRVKGRLPGVQGRGAGEGFTTHNANGNKYPLLVSEATTAMTTTTKRRKIEKATREQSYLKMGLMGPPNAGKSFTSLRIAHLLVQAGIGSQIGVIETEAGKIKKYVNLAPDGIPFDFFLCVLDSYSPLEYMGAIEDMIAEGCDFLIIDQISHAWRGKDGILETVDATEGKNKFTSGWKVASPLQNKFIDMLLQSKVHLICTMRSKVETILVDQPNQRGEMVKTPKRIGMAPVQREDIEYEFEIVGSLDQSHVLTITKTICSDIDGAVFIKPGKELADPLAQWLHTGQVLSAPKIIMREMALDEQLAAILGLYAELGFDNSQIEKEKEKLLKSYGARELHQLNQNQAEEYLKRLVGEKKKAEKAAEKAKEKVTEKATEKPADTAGEPPTADISAAAPAAPPAAPNGKPKPPPDPERDAALKRLAANRGMYYRLAGITTEAGQKSAWIKILDKWKVTSALELATEQIRELSANLSKQCDELAEKKPVPPGAPF